MFLSLFLSVANCLLEKVPPSHSVSSYIMGDTNTVHFIKSQVMELVNSSFSPIEDESVITRLIVYRGEPSRNNVFYKDDKTSEENSFFFTTSSREPYHVVLEVLSDEEDRHLGIDYKIFSGEANRPNIVSNNDVEVSKAENLVERVLDFVRKNITIQSMDEEDEAVYKKLYEEIMRKALYVLILKISATIFTMYYSNKKTKSFYASQGLGTDK